MSGRVPRGGGIRGRQKEQFEVVLVEPRQRHDRIRRAVRENSLLNRLRLGHESEEKEEKSVAGHSFVSLHKDFFRP